MSKKQKQVKAVVVPKEMAATVTQSDIFNRTVPFRVEIHSFGQRRKASLESVTIPGVEDRSEERTVKSQLDLTQKLLISEEVDAIHRHDGRFVRRLRDMSTPLSDGIYLISLPMIEMIDTDAVAWQHERAALVDKAAETYQARVRETQEKAGPFARTDYPTVQQFKDAFWTHVQFLNFGVPDVLKAVKGSIFEREHAKVQRQAASAAAQIEQHLATSLQEITNHLVMVLQPKSNGRMPKLYDNALDRLTRYLDTLALRDVTDFKALKTVTARLKDLSAGVTVEQIRDDKDLRARLASGVEEAKEAVNALVHDEPVRAIRFANEDVA